MRQMGKLAISKTGEKKKLNHGQMSENICSRSLDKLVSPWVSNSLSACPLSAQSPFYSRSLVMTWWGRKGNFPLHVNAIFALTVLSQLWSQLLFTALGATPGCSFRLVARCRWAEESGSLVLDTLHTAVALIAVCCCSQTQEAPILASLPLCLLMVAAYLTHFYV